MPFFRSLDTATEVAHAHNHFDSHHLGLDDPFNLGLLFARTDPGLDDSNLVQLAMPAVSRRQSARIGSQAPQGSSPSVPSSAGPTPLATSFSTTTAAASGSRSHSSATAGTRLPGGAPLGTPSAYSLKRKRTSPVKQENPDGQAAASTLPAARQASLGSLDEAEIETVDLCAADKAPADLFPKPKPKNEVKLDAFQCVICIDDANDLTVTHCGKLCRTRRTWPCPAHAPAAQSWR